MYILNKKQKHYNTEDKAEDKTCNVKFYIEDYI